MTDVETKSVEPFDWGKTLRTARDRALGGGIPGAAAMGLQVCSLMWMRTIMNYQYRHGTTTREAARTLYAQGGIARFYRGIGPALFQGPLSRFGDTAANAAVMSLMDSSEQTRQLPTVVKTLAASVTAASWRIFLMPIDALKTTLQVEGAQGLKLLSSKIKVGGPFVLYHGSLGAASATLVGHMPWFTTYNLLNQHLPTFDGAVATLVRNAGMGFCASVVSDVTSNSLRVVKTTKQTYSTPITYMEALRVVVEADGWRGLFGRGLQTRIMANGVQGMLFMVLWKALEKEWKARNTSQCHDDCSDH